MHFEQLACKERSSFSGPKNFAYNRGLFANQRLTFINGRVSKPKGAPTEGFPGNGVSFVLERVHLFLGRSEDLWTQCLVLVHNGAH